MSGKPSKIRTAIREKMLAQPHLPNTAFSTEFQCSTRLVAYIRSELVKSGAIPGGRRTALPAELAEALILHEGELDDAPSPPRSTTTTASSDAATPSTPSEIIALANDFTDEDDEATRKQLLRKVRAIALDPEMHPDTVLSAAQAYIKLKDAVKAKSLGPGKPLNREEATKRLTSLLTACGPSVALAAFEAAFKGLISNAAHSSGVSDPIHSPNDSSEAP